MQSTRPATAPEANPRKTSSIRRLGAVDVAALREAVLAIPESVWEAENADKPNRFEALDRTTHIVFRFVSSFQDWRDAYDRPLWAQWRALVQPVMAQAVESYGYARGTFPRVMLARMAPGGIIKPHRDANPAAKWPHKIHVPLLTNERVTFHVDGVPYKFAEGEAVEPYGYTRGMFPRVMLARMAPGGIIKPHRDANPAAKWPHKIHVPLLTNERVTFYVDGVPYKFAEGEAVEVNNMGVHAVTNEGDGDRIHLIFEYYDAAQPAPEWVGPSAAPQN